MSDFNQCCIDLTEKGFSPQSAARACAIAQYRKESGKVKDVSKEAMKVATSFSRESESECKLSIEEDAFEFKIDSGEEFPDPFEPFFDMDRGWATRMLRQILLCRVGTFNGIQITEEKLQEFEDNFSRPLPFQKDHKTDYDSKVGELLAVRKVGKRIFGLAEFVGIQIIDDIQKGKARHVSIGFNLTPGRLREVSLTHFPAVDGEDPARIINPKLKPKKFNQEDPGSNEQSKGNVEMSQKTDPESQVDLSHIQSTLKVIQERNEALEKKLEEQNKQIELQNKQLEEQNRQVRFKEAEGAIVEFCAKGLSVPSAGELELQFFNSLTDEQRAQYKEIKEKNGPVILLSRVDKKDTKILSAPEDKVSEQSNSAFDAAFKK